MTEAALYVSIVLWFWIRELQTELFKQPDKLNQHSDPIHNCIPRTNLSSLCAWGSAHIDTCDLLHSELCQKPKGKTLIILMI